MIKRKEKAFTLIELIATLVIMAIIALIVTPLVMNIIKKARISADKRSVDAYGRSIELAIAGYLLDTGKFPTEVSQLTIEYSGNEVVCDTTQIKSDSSLYLAGCTVNGRNVEGYTYGKEETVSYKSYSIGDEVTYNNVDYYVIKDSDASDSTLTLLKAEPLSVQEVNTYGGVGTENNHVNMYVTRDTSVSYYQQAYDRKGYGGMAYYTSETCGTSGTSGCTVDYAKSEVKYVVDAWASAQAPAVLEARLITKSEIDDNFEFEDFEYYPCGGPYCPAETGKRIKDTWMYNSSYWWYWTMTPSSSENLWVVQGDGQLGEGGPRYSDNYGAQIAVRPVIVLPKSAL